MACLISIITQSLIYPCSISCSRGSQRQTDKSKRDLKTYNEYDWLDMSLKGTLQQLTVKELEKYLTAHGLGKYGKKSDKIKTISCHVLGNNELNSIKEKQLEMADFMSYADQQDDESLSDDDSVVGTEVTVSKNGKVKKILFVITIWVLCKKGGPLNLLTLLKGGYLKNMGDIE